MAANLNKTRKRDTALVALLALVLFVGTEPIWVAPERQLANIFAGLLVGFCAIGRVYCTAFLGGHKNETLITYGPFSVMRNPLYFLTLIGAAGVALATARPIIIVLPLGIGVIYHFLIKREEAFLREKFGEAYADYCATTPSLIPNLRLYQAPKRIESDPLRLLRAVFDAGGWFVIIPLMQLAEARLA